MPERLVNNLMRLNKSQLGGITILDQAMRRHNSITVRPHLGMRTISLIINGHQFQNLVATIWQALYDGRRHAVKCLMQQSYFFLPRPRKHNNRYRQRRLWAIRDTPHHLIVRKTLIDVIAFKQNNFP